MISVTYKGRILLVITDNPPVNALSQPVREGIWSTVDAAQTDERADAVVIACAGRTFFAGADISEFGKPRIAPLLPALIDRIESSRKPVIAAIHGSALGGGLELALGCHYRIAVESATFGLPEVKLGLLPGAGGTQRLPRMIGMAPALEMIVNGNPIEASAAATLGLIDHVAAKGALVDAAVAFARRVIGKRLPITRERSDKLACEAALFDRFMEVNARRFRGHDAPIACIEAVKAAATIPYAQGIAREQALFATLMEGDQSKAKRHIFFAERAARKVAGVSADTSLLPIRKIGVLGAGTMGCGIAMNFLSAGLPVLILEKEKDALDRGVAAIEGNYTAAAAKGRMQPEIAKSATDRLTPTLFYDDLSDCDLIIEAVFESMEIKKDVFARLNQVVKSAAVLASNTSYLNINEIASVTARPENVLGMHFFSPANIMKLLEVVRGAKTSPIVVATVMALARTIGKIPVVAGVGHGFIGNRILARRQEQANRLILEGARPSEVDRVLVDFGMPMGPFQMADLAGLDVGWHRDPTIRRTVRDILCAEGRLGQKTNAGFYDYNAQRRPSRSELVERLIADIAAVQGIEQRAIGAQEIIERCLYPMVNEGAKILEEGIAQRGSDIDLVWVNGYGWPTYRGGPMFWADTIGLDTVISGLKRYSSWPGSSFTLSSLLETKTKLGERLSI